VQNGGERRSYETNAVTRATEVRAFPSTPPSPMACTPRCISQLPPCPTTTGRSLFSLLVETSQQTMMYYYDTKRHELKKEESKKKKRKNA